jgi:hypothetical protein
MKNQNNHITAFHKNKIKARKLAMKIESDIRRAEHEKTLVEEKPKMLTTAKASWVF